MAYSLFDNSLAGCAQATEAPALILKDGKFTTLDKAQPAATAVAIANGRFAAMATRKK